jgi:hypothetical protein
MHLAACRERSRTERDGCTLHRKRYIRYTPNARATNVAFSQRIHLHITGGGLWLIANFATCEPAVAAANCPRPLAVIESTDVPQRYGDTIMKRTSLIVAILALCLSSAGCCCCNWLRRPAAPVAVCPAPPPVCNPCATAPVTYGAPAAYGAPVAPVAPYAPPPQW